MRRGFTLVELSIVLVIVGLILGGILTARTLLRSAEIRNTMAQANSYIAATSAFRNKYDAWPGDMRNATRYWGIAAGATGNDATCRAASTTGQATCNGNGDGKVWTADSGVTNSEIFHAWKQLANEGLIEGSYTGVAGASGVVHSIVGTNIPGGAMKDSGYAFWYTAEGVVDTDWFPTQDGNMIFVGEETAGSFPIDPLFTTPQAKAIDDKLDDGRPGLGAVRTFKSNANCVTTTSPSTATYNLSTAASPACSMIMHLGNAD